VPVVPWEGATDQLTNFYHAVLKEKVVNFLRKEKCAPREKVHAHPKRTEKILTRMRKGSRLTLGWPSPNG